MVQNGEGPEMSKERTFLSSVLAKNWRDYFASTTKANHFSDPHTERLRAEMTAAQRRRMTKQADTPGTRPIVSLFHQLSRNLDFRGTPETGEPSAVVEK